MKKEFIRALIFEPWLQHGAKIARYPRLLRPFKDIDRRFADKLYWRRLEMAHEQLIPAPFYDRVLRPRRRGFGATAGLS